MIAPKQIRIEFSFVAITYRHSSKVRQVSSFVLFETLINKTSKFLDVSLKPSHTGISGNAFGTICYVFKARKFEFACMRKDEALDELSSSHEAELSSLKGQLAHQTQTHNNHKMQLEEHYQLMVEDLKQKLKVETFLCLLN